MTTVAECESQSARGNETRKRNAALHMRDPETTVWAVCVSCKRQENSIKIAMR